MTIAPQPVKPATQSFMNKLSQIKAMIIEIQDYLASKTENTDQLSANISAGNGLIKNFEKHEKMFSRLENIEAARKSFAAATTQFTQAKKDIVDYYHAVEHRMNE